MVQVEDAVAQTEQQNLTGTVGDHPNWQRRLEAPVAALLARSDVQALFDAVAAERRRTGG